MSKCICSKFDLFCVMSSPFNILFDFSCKFNLLSDMSYLSSCLNLALQDILCSRIYVNDEAKKESIK